MDQTRQQTFRSIKDIDIIIDILAMSFLDYTFEYRVFSDYSSRVVICLKPPKSIKKSIRHITLNIGDKIVGSRRGFEIIRGDQNGS